MKTRSRRTPGMSGRAHRAGHFLLMAILAISIGGHLVVIQTTAWASMLVNYSNEGSFSEAVSKPFDGQHPCPLCKVVEKSKKEEGEKTLSKSPAKMEVALPVPVNLPYPGVRDVIFRVPEYGKTFAIVYPSVPTPPPRGA